MGANDGAAGVDAAGTDRGAAVTTDSQRREATDQWTIELREKQLRDLRAQLAAVTAERDALALATSSTPGKGTGVWVPIDKWQELQDQLRALQVDAGTLVRLRDDTDNVLWSLKPADIAGAINWGDLGTRETQEVIDEQRRWYRVIIEEADPANPALHAAVLAGLVALGWKANDIEIETAW